MNSNALKSDISAGLNSARHHNACTNEELLTYTLQAMRGYFPREDKRTRRGKIETDLDTKMSELAVLIHQLYNTESAVSPSGTRKRNMAWANS